MLATPLVFTAALWCFGNVLGTQASPSFGAEHDASMPRAPLALLRRDVNASKAGISSISLSSDGSSYFALAQLGNISFQLALDTGSSDLWLVSSACSSKQFCDDVPSYPLSFHSPSFEVINNNQTGFNVSFADGTVASGYLARETVQVSNLSLGNQVFGLVNSSNVSLTNDISGVLGMGFPRLSVFSTLVNNSTPFVNGLAQSGLLDYPFFGLSLTRGNNGTLSLGAIDANVVKNASAIEWHKVVPFSPFTTESNTSSYLQWAIRMPQFGVNGTMFDTQATYASITDTSLALLDVGTNGIFGPYQDVSRLFSSISEARIVDVTTGQWAVPCDTEETMVFNFGQGNITLQPTDYLIGPVSTNPALCLSWPRASQSSGDGLDWHLGTPFLRTVYSIFSYGIDGKEPPMIGLYLLSNVTTSQNSSVISSFFDSQSLTIATTLPNVVLTTPSATTPTYIFNTSVPATPGELEGTALGTSTYSALLSGPTVNASALPSVTLPPTIITLIVTDASGVVSTSIETATTSSVKLGVPPGESSSQVSLSVPTMSALWIVAISLLHFLCL